MKNIKLIIFVLNILTCCFSCFAMQKSDDVTSIKTNSSSANSLNEDKFKIDYLNENSKCFNLPTKNCFLKNLTDENKLEIKKDEKSIFKIFKDNQTSKIYIIKTKTGFEKDHKDPVLKSITFYAWVPKDLPFDIKFIYENNLIKISKIFYDKEGNILKKYIFDQDFCRYKKINYQNMKYKIIYNEKIKFKKFYNQEDYLYITKFDRENAKIFFNINSLPEIEKNMNIKKAIKTKFNNITNWILTKPTDYEIDVLKKYLENNYSCNKNIKNVENVNNYNFNILKNNRYYKKYDEKYKDESDDEENENIINIPLINLDYLKQCEDSFIKNAEENFYNNFYSNTDVSNLIEQDDYLEKNMPYEYTIKKNKLGEIEIEKIKYYNNNNQDKSIYSITFFKPFVELENFSHTDYIKTDTLKPTVKIIFDENKNMIRKYIFASRYFLNGLYYDADKEKQIATHLIIYPKKTHLQDLYLSNIKKLSTISQHDINNGEIYVNLFFGDVNNNKNSWVLVNKQNNQN